VILVTAPKRRGRRPAGEETRGALLRAARELFAEGGYEHTTVRALGARAGVDPAMVNHWFGGKAELFAAAVLDLPFRPEELVERTLTGDPEHLPERLVRTFLTIWDAGGMGPLLRNVTTQPQLADMMRELIERRVLTPVLGSVLPSKEPERAAMRANLCASQIIGMGLVRYVLAFEPMASADVEPLVTAVAPTLRRYLTGDIDTAAGGSPRPS
jgi:AcrR family transcriptional regulator